MANADFTTQFTHALMHTPQGALIHYIDNTVPQITQIEKESLLTAHAALTAEIATVDSIFEGWLARYIELLDSATTAREMALIRYADCCVESSIH